MAAVIQGAVRCQFEGAESARESLSDDAWPRPLLPRGDLVEENALSELRAGIATETSPFLRQRPATLGNAFLLVLVVALARAMGRPIVGSIIAGWLWPFLVWNWLMGFVIYQHHTHPSVVWFTDFKEWQYWESQIEGTPHIRFPWIVNFFLHNIMEHTAHHALTGIPLYNLRQAQKRLESKLRAVIIVQKWTFAEYRRTVKACKLYDYTNQCWLNFDGLPTSACTGQVRCRSMLNHSPHLRTR